jgi:hypothetical protein
MAMGIGRWSFRSVGAKLVILIALAIVGFTAWLMLPEPSGADNKTVGVASRTSASSQEQTATTPSETKPTEQAMATPPQAAVEGDTAAVGTAEAVTAERSPIDGLKISSQSWRRGGLGSKALVTLTLRNANEFAVKDIEIACAFTRADGSHLTDRRRVISDTINMKSRKTYAGMMVGFVNVNANKAKCSIVTASRT